jgi:phosphoribosylformylglycinamidine cyclo-ligase
LLKRGTMKKATYRDSGVDIGRYERLIPFIKKQLKAGSERSGGGLFAGMLDLRKHDRSERLLVASVDGVGTKVRVAKEYGRHSGIGKDIVSHCVNDILCLGARPVAFMDYIAFDRLDTNIFKQVLRGIASECRANDIELLGGETAEMPGVYRKGEYDLVGCIFGLVSEAKAVDGSRIRRGDLVVGLPSNGLHTNGYSLARKVLLKRGRLRLSAKPRGWRRSLGSALLQPHTNYLKQVHPLVEMKLVSGIAHITGGGIRGNLARILPAGCSARLKRSLWRVPPVFDLIAATGRVEEGEMLRVFNMGLGMLLVTPHGSLPQVLKQTRGSRVVGEIEEGSGEVVIE